MSAVAFKAGCEGWIKLVAHTPDADGNIISSRDLTDWFPNLILDQGLDAMGGQFGWKAYCQVGTGTTAPTVIDTSLQTYLAGAGYFNGTASYVAGPPPYAAVNGQYRFAVGVATGNLTEIGFGWLISGATLYSRALVLDGGGSPTSITVLSTEILDVYYQHRVYPPTTDVTGTISISGVDYDYTVRASRINASNFNTLYHQGWGSRETGDQMLFYGWNDNAIYQNYLSNGTLGALTGSPSGTTAQGGDVSTAAYVPGSLEAVGTMTCNIGTGNIPGGFTCFTIGTGLGLFQIEFDPIVPKDNTKVFTIELIATWDRYSI